MSKVEQQTKVIEITISGPTGVGKSHLAARIEQMIKQDYGIHAMVTSYELSHERAGASADTEKWAKPDIRKTVFVIKENNT